MRDIAIKCLIFYQRYVSLDQGWLGRFLGRSQRICRHEPSCSSYMIEALERFGWRGLGLGLKRLGKCHPWGSWGWDPVPER